MKTSEKHESIRQLILNHTKQRIKQNFSKTAYSSAKQSKNTLISVYTKKLQVIIIILNIVTLV